MGVSLGYKIEPQEVNWRRDPSGMPFSSRLLHCHHHNNNLIAVIYAFLQNLFKTFSKNIKNFQKWKNKWLVRNALQKMSKLANEQRSVSQNSMDATFCPGFSTECFKKPSTLVKV